MEAKGKRGCQIARPIFTLQSTPRTVYLDNFLEGECHIAVATTTAAEYLWSGHRGYLGIEQIPWLTTERVLSMLSTRTNEARAVYDLFIIDGLSEGRRGEFHSGSCEGRILGDDQFTDEILEKVQQNVEREYTLEQVVRAVCDHYRISPEQLQSPGKARPMAEARGVAAAIVQESSHLRLTDLAKLLKRDNSALSKAARRLTVAHIVRAIAGSIRESEGKPALQISKCQA